MHHQFRLVGWGFNFWHHPQRAQAPVHHQLRLVAWGFNLQHHPRPKPPKVKHLRLFPKSLLLPSTQDALSAQAAGSYYAYWPPGVHSTFAVEQQQQQQQQQFRPAELEQEGQSHASDPDQSISEEGEGHCARAVEGSIQSFLDLNSAAQRVPWDLGSAGAEECGPRFSRAVSSK